jgi:hypothetical protein
LTFETRRAIIKKVLEAGLPEHCELQQLLKGRTTTTCTGERKQKKKKFFLLLGQAIEIRKSPYVFELKAMKGPSGHFQLQQKESNTF